MAHKIQLRRDTSAVWAAVNPILADGEMGLETDTRYMKFGDGSTPWNGLEYVQAGPRGLAPLTLSGSAPSTGAIGSAYSFTPTISGGTGPYTVTLISGALPAGLSLNSTTGAISGTPTTATSYTPILKVTDSTGATDNLALGTITIGAGGGTALSISGTPVTSGTVGTAYTGFSVSASGGTSPYTYSIASGSLPAGLSLNSSTGAVSGTPTTAATSSGIVIRVTDAASATANLAAFSVTVGAAATAPGAPTGLTLGTATTTTQPLSWTAPSSNGGASITDYVVQRAPAGSGTWTTFADGTSTGTSATVTGLTAGTSYDYRVAAVNSVNQGAYSSTATGSTAAAATAPGAPTGVTATAGNASASVAFTAPASNGGATITGYTATSSPGGFTGTGTGSPITVSGLTNGTAYTFTVHATNSVGDSVESSASSAVTPVVPVDTRPRFFVAPSTAGSSGQQAFIDGATKFGSNGGKAGSFSLVTTSGNYGWYVALASAGTPTFTSASAPGFPGGWTSQGTFAATQGSMQLWRQDFPNANPTPGDTWTVS